LTRKAVFVLARIGDVLALAEAARVDVWIKVFFGVVVAAGAVPAVTAFAELV
jgi:hypothetical protein